MQRTATRTCCCSNTPKGASSKDPRLSSSPRNWLIDGGEIKVIDFGRFDFRPPETDFCRLAVQQWRADNSLEAAFLEGYGADPRDEELWRIMLLREAVGTAVWAYQVGDAAFEAQGHRMPTEAMARFPR